MANIGQPPGGGYGAPPGGGYPGAPQGGYGAPQPMGGAPMGGPPMGAPAGDAPNFMLWVILGVVNTLVCGGWIFGLPGAILAFLGKNDWDAGKHDAGRGKLKISKILTIIGFVLGGLGIIAYIILMVVAGASGATSY